MTTTQRSFPARKLLLDVPTSWFSQALATLDSVSHLRLLQSSKALRDLVMQCSKAVTLTFTLPISDDHVTAARNSLLLAEQHAGAGRVHLALHGQEWEDQPAPSLPSQLHGQLGPMPGAMPETAMACLSSAKRFLCGEADESITLLISIGSVTLRCMPLLDSLYPTWLTQACPHLTALHLLKCDVTGLHGPTTTTTTSSCCLPQLRHLHIDLWCARRSKQTMGCWRVQLQGLTGLNSLSIGGDDGPRYRFLSSCRFTIGNQIHVLTLTHPRPPNGLDERLCDWFPHLTYLDLGEGWTVEDDDLEVILDMHELRWLKCGTVWDLEENYTHSSAPWTHLVLPGLDLGSLARVPLGGTKCVHVSSTLQPCVWLSTDALANARAVEMLTKCEIEWQGPPEVLHLWLQQSGTMETHVCLAAVKVLLSSCPAKNIIVMDAHTREALPVIVTDP